MADIYRISLKQDNLGITGGATSITYAQTITVEAFCSIPNSAAKSTTSSTQTTEFSLRPIAYPNPATELLTLPEGATQAQLLNAQGQLAERPNATGQLDVYALLAGLYNLQFYQDSKLVNQHIEVQH